MRLLETAAEFWDTWWGLISLLAAAVGALLQHRYQISNRLSKAWSKWLNRQTEVSVALEYRASRPFAEIKKAAKAALRQGGDLAVLSETEHRMDLTVGIFALRLTSSQDENVLVKLNRTACGIRDLKGRLSALLAAVAKLAGGEKPVLGQLVYADLHFLLPYQWEHLVITPPKQLALTEYTVSLVHEAGPHVEVTKAGVKIQATTTDMLRPVLDAIL